MIAAVPTRSSDPSAAQSSAAARRPWAPDANDHLVYHLARFGGQKQDFVAKMLGISQPTVSRIIDRYERWQAHADPREGGRLDPAERLRAQRWLTYERNELILASALRIADQMEGFTELSKSVISRPMSQFTKETEIRSESATVDRHGIAARFLRLAFRINMEQLKLVSQDVPPLPEPLTAEELAEQEAQAAEIAAEFAAVAQAQAEADEAERRRVAEEQRVAEQMADQMRAARQRVAELTSAGHESSNAPEAVAAGAEFADDPKSDHPVAEEEVRIQRENKMNTSRAAKSDASAAPADSCACGNAAEDFSPGMHGPPIVPSAQETSAAFP